ncbi:MAG: pyridoxal phosphate-dependent aminotransferase [Thermoplasmata archaeon]
MSEPPFDAFRYAHDHYSEIAWMSQNTNHLVPPEVVHDALLRAVDEHRFEDYPYAPGDRELRELVLADLGFAPDAGFLMSAGGTEALYMLTRALLGPSDEVIASDPSYLIIHKFIELSGARTRNLEIYQPPFRLTSDRVREAIGPKTKAILLIDPLNPLGSSYPKEEVRAIAELAHDHHLLLVNDVTYRDFADEPTLAAPFAPDETVTVWSVSKNCGLAGLRLGGLSGPTDLVARIARFNTNDLGVNVLAQAAALAALRTKRTWFPKVKATSRANQERIREVVATVPGASLPVFPSQANMFAIDLAKTEVAPDALQRHLLVDHRVFVRSGSYLSPQFGARFVRVSFSNPPSDVERFVTAFPSAVARLRPRPAV